MRCVLGQPVTGQWPLLSAAALRREVMAAPAAGCPALTAELLGWLREQLAPVLAPPPSRSLGCLQFRAWIWCWWCLRSQTRAPWCHSEPEPSWGAQLRSGRLLLPEPGWHLPLEAAPKCLRSQSNLAVLPCAPLPAGLRPG